VSKRKDGNVLESNLYVFAQPKSGSHLRGSDVMKKYDSECGAQCPEALRGTALRKHVAIISQVLNLRDNDLDLFAQYMGHSIKDFLGCHTELKVKRAEGLSAARVRAVNEAKIMHWFDELRADERQCAKHAKMYMEFGRKWSARCISV